MKLMGLLIDLGLLELIALDISKVFNSVLHADLLHKLTSHGISGRIIDLIVSFLINRCFEYTFNG